MSTDRVPASRIRACNRAPLRDQGEFVLYWMIAAQRARDNFALQRAIEHARALQKPLVVFEPLRSDYPWASDRLHRFVLDGMRDNAASFAKAPVYYYPYVERDVGAGKGLLDALAKKAALIVTDE